jgi:hypothetical protein
LSQQPVEADKQTENTQSIKKDAVKIEEIKAVKETSVKEPEKKPQPNIDKAITASPAEINEKQTVKAKLQNEGSVKIGEPDALPPVPKTKVAEKP